MGKLSRWLVGFVVLLAVAWSGAWLYGRHKIRDVLDQRIALLGQRGVDASYEALEIGGFPFGYEGRIVAPRYAARRQGSAVEWQAPWVEVDAAAAEMGTVRFALPDEQRIVMDRGDAAPVELIVRAQGFEGSLVPGRERARLEAKAPRLTVMTVPGRGPDLSLDLTEVALIMEGPPKPRGAPASEMFGELTAAAASLKAREPGPGLAPFALDTGAVQGKARLDAGLANLWSQIDEAVLTVEGGGTVEVAAATVQGRGPLRPPPGEAVEVTGLLDLVDATASESLWQIIDPQGAVPREAERLLLDLVVAAAPGGTGGDIGPLLGAEGPLRVDGLEVRAVEVDALGLDLSAEGAGRLVEGRPEGSLTVRSRGARQFIASASEAGWLPPQLTRVLGFMVGVVGREGEGEAEQVFNVVMRNGLTFVNGLPVGPSPRFR